MDRISGVGGHLAHHRRPHGRRVLLPYEIDLCEQLGVTEQEYWDFIFEAQEYVAKRGEEYELIPDIRNEPVSLTTTQFILLSIGLAVASTAISLLLAPKPASPKQRDRRANLEITGTAERTRYTRASGFDSVQQLANIGEIVPLVFADHKTAKDDDGNEFRVGGVRVETDMLFSHMATYGRNQVLSTILSLGLHRFDRIPDYNGLAIGDLLISDYPASKLRVFFSQDSRITDSDRYPEGKLWEETAQSYENIADPFSLWIPPISDWKPHFSGTRTPSTTIEFGAYNPIPNGHKFLVPYEFINRLQKSGKEAKFNAEQKRQKLAIPFPTMCGLVATKNDQYTYRIVSQKYDTGFVEENNVEYGDVISYQNDIRANADSALQINERFLVGEVMATVVQRDTGINPWDADDTNLPNYEYTLEVDDFRGHFKIANTDNAGGKLIEPASKFDYKNGNSGPSPWMRECLQQVAVGSVFNSRPCNTTEIGIKSNVWRQMTGAALFNDHPSKGLIKDYNDPGGDDQAASISLSTQTKYTTRYSFFKLYIKKEGSETWIDMNGDIPFAVKSARPVDIYNTIHIRDKRGVSTNEFKFVPLPGSHFYKKMRDGEVVDVYRLDGRPMKDTSGRRNSRFTKDDFVVIFTGRTRTLHVGKAANSEWIVDWNGKASKKKQPVWTESWKPWDELTESNANYFPLNAICDMFINDTETSSHANGPEHVISSVTEIVHEPEAPPYTDISTIGMKIVNSKEWTTFSNVTAYIRKGLIIERLTERAGDERIYGASNLFPEIAYNLLTNPEIGGAYATVGRDSVDRESMALTARYCLANHFYWDGVIAERVNLREFIFEQAGYILCDFTIIGGRFALKPSVPVQNNEGHPKIDPNGKPEIKALFTDGNVRKMEVSFLSPEERQDFTAVVLYRDETVNGFPETRSSTISWKKGGESLPIEEFDMTQFCTNREHAEFFAKYALMVRRYVDHGIKFETTPQAAMHMAPGDYFRFASKVTHTSEFGQGFIDDQGFVTTSDALEDGDHEIVFWDPGTEEGLRPETLTVKDSKTKQQSLWGVLFTLKNETSQNRVYKCESLTYAEDGLVEVSGSFVPLTDSGTLKVINWNNNDFRVERG